MRFPRIFALFLATVPAGAWAQSSTSDGVSVPTALERCEADRLLLSQTILEMRKNETDVPTSDDRLAQCLRRVDDQERVNRSMIASEDDLRAKLGTLETQVADYKKTTGDVGLLEKKLASATARGDRLETDLRAVRTSLDKAEPRAALTDQLEKDVAIYKTVNGQLEDELAAARAEVEKLRARLNRYDIPLTAGFAYHADSAYDSFVTEDDMPEDLRYKPLAAARCLEALNWISAQSGEQAPVFKSVWVQQDGDWRVCTRGADGFEITRSAPGLEAHLVFFR